MVLIVSAIFPPEPVVSANMSFDIASVLSEGEEQVTVVSPYPTRPYGKDYEKSEIYKKYPFNHTILESYTSAQSSLIGRFKESYSLGQHTKKYIVEHHHDIEVIYANTWPLFAQKYLVQTACKYNIPVVLHVQDIYPESMSKKIPFVGALVQRLFFPMDKKLLTNSTKIVTISYKMRNYLISSRNLIKDKIEVVRNWQNDNIFINYQNKQQNNYQFTFMYLGSISPTAGVSLLIHSFGKADLKKSKLIIAGGGSDKEKCLMIAKNYPGKEIEFYEVSGDEVPKIQASADVLMLPLKKGIAKTALPSKLTAYMFSGKPIIASIDLDSEPADIIRDNSCGFIVEPENEEQLIQCMQNILKTSKDDLAQMGKQGFKYAKENLSREHNLSKIVKIIHDTKRETVQC